MSGDVQPRKRKDKRRKRDAFDRKSEGELSFSRSASFQDDDESSHGVHITKMGNEDVHLHVQHEHGTGGHWCAKVIFFALMAVLLGLVGLIILENRGLTDLDTPLSESRFSNYFDGWVDEHRVEHDHDDVVEASIDDHEDRDEPFEEDDLGESEADGDEDDAEEEEQQENEDEDDQEDDDDDVDATAEQTAEVDEEDDANNDEADGEDDDDDDEDVDENNTFEQIIEDNRNSVEENENDDNDNNGGEVDDDGDDDESNIKPTSQYSTNAANNKDDDDDDEDMFDDDDDDNAFDSFDNVIENDPDELLLLQRKAAEAAQSQQSSQANVNDGDNDDANEVESPSWARSLAVKIGVGVALALVARLVLIRKNPNTIEEPTAEMLMKRRYTMATSDEQIPDDEDEVPTPLEDEYSEEEVEIEEEIEVYDNGDDDIEIDETNDDIAISGNYVPETFEQLQALYRPKESHVEMMANEEILESKKKMPAVFHAPPPPPTSSLQESKFNTTTAATATATKPVAVATSLTKAEKEEEQPKQTQAYTSVDRNREITHDVDYNEDEDDDDIDYDEDEDEDELDDVADNEARKGDDGQGDISDEESYEIDLDDNDISDVDDTDLMNRLEAKYGRLPAKEYESDEDPDDPTWTQINPKQSSNAGGAQIQPGQELNNNEDDNDDDENDAAAFELFQQELLRANAHMMEEKNYPIALKAFALLTQKYSHIPEAFLGQAKVLDHLADAQQSNKLLNEAIEAYKRYLAFDNVIKNDTEYREAAERCIERMRFMGYHQQTVVIHEQLIERFSNESKYHNQLSLTYLMMDRLADVKRISQATLRRWPSDGLAHLHFGLALKKLDDNKERAAYFMTLGLNSNATGTQEGFYYLTLGEMLQRMGRVQEAMKIFERGAKLKIFPSAYQRSLYNEPNLRAQPYWTSKETSYGQQLKKLEDNWQAIRDEALALLSRQGYFVNEAENLRDKGNWQQFELYARGQRQQKNCRKAPITCGMIAQFKEASGCKRGQVKFSVLHPDSHVWPHCGPTNCRLRAHLGLVVPKGTSLRVVQTARTWSEGKFLIFDDSFEHEVWHNGTSLRLVLIVDIWHPDLGHEQRQKLTAI